MSAQKRNKEKKNYNTQEKLSNSVQAVPGDNRNQNHNIKKEGLGPNTKR